MKESDYRRPILDALAYHLCEIIRAHPGRRQLADGGWIVGPAVGTFDYTVGIPVDGVYRSGSVMGTVYQPSF